MQLVINISDGIYNNVALTKNIRDKYIKDVGNAIAEGIILPKGHGRLVDAKKLEEWCDLYRELPMKKWRLIFQNEPCVLDADMEVKLNWEDYDRSHKYPIQEYDEDSLPW